MANAPMADTRGNTAAVPVFSERGNATDVSVAPGSLVGNDSSHMMSGSGRASNDTLVDTMVRRNAELSDVYTRSEGFRTVVAKADDPALVVFRGIPDQYTESGNRLALTVPSDAFAHTQPKAIVRLAATMQDGRPLPTWVQFNGQTGQFVGEVPSGQNGELRIKIIARDAEGREATSLFRINIGNMNVKNGDAVKAPGKVSLSDRLRQPTLPMRRIG
jgi:hypothetical protein